jgi:hypothetical protein
MPKPCFSYDVVPPVPHDSKVCFSNDSGGIPLGIQARDGLPSAVHGSKISFSYSIGVPWNGGNRNIAPHDSKLCFSY